MWLPPDRNSSRDVSVGIVDLSKFEQSRFPGQDVVDYFFQLRRASPSVRPIFGFVHEFAQPNSAVTAFLAGLWRKTNGEAGK